MDIRTLSRSCIISCMLASVASAAPVFVKTPLDDKAPQKVITDIMPDDTQTDEIKFWASSDVDFSQPFEYLVEAPIGSVVTVAAAPARGNGGPSKVRASKFYPIKMGETGNSNLADKLVIEKRPSSSASIGLPVSLPFQPAPTNPTSFVTRALGTDENYCCGLSRTVFSVVAAQYRLISPGCDDACVCEKISVSPTCGGSSAGPTPTGGGDNPISTPIPVNTPPGNTSEPDFYENPNNGYVQAIGTFRKDECDKSAKKHLIVVSVNVSKVNKANFPNGIRIRTTFVELNHRGSRATSIKPRSDGKFAPRPLALMANVSYGNEELRIVKWTNGKPTSVKILEVISRNNVYYRGRSLMRVPIAGILTGGKANFELFDSQSGLKGYGVCVSLAPVRQRLNGYPTSARD